MNTTSAVLEARESSGRDGFIRKTEILVPKSGSFKAQERKSTYQAVAFSVRQFYIHPSTKCQVSLK